MKESADFRQSGIRDLDCVDFLTKAAFPKQTTMTTSHKSKDDHHCQNHYPDAEGYRIFQRHIKEIFIGQKQKTGSSDRVIQ